VRQDSETEAPLEPAAPEARAEQATDSAKAAAGQTQVQQGRVLRVTSEEVLVALPDGREGAVPIAEFAGQPLPKDSDTVSVIVENTPPVDGKLVLNKRQADELTFWEAVQPGDLIEGVVIGMNKGGLDVDIGGARTFLPASQVDIHRMRDISLLIGEHVRCVVTDVDRTTRDLVVSPRSTSRKSARRNGDRHSRHLSRGKHAPAPSPM
jgi:ribosomal protein S1